MAEFDYAYLADYAAVSDGKLTAVGASFTYLVMPELPVQFRVAIAGRLRVPLDESVVHIRVRVVPPDKEYDVTLEGTIVSGGDQEPYRENLRGVLFALNFEIPVLRFGLHEVLLEIDDELVRRLAFEVRKPA